MTQVKTRNGDLALIDQMVDSFFDLQLPRFAYTAIPLDLYEEEGKYVLELPVPGFDPKEIEVEVTGNTISISGTHAEQTEKKDVRYHRHEMRRGSFSRSVTLPQDLDPNKVVALVEKGILKLTVTPVAPFAPKKIEVKSA